MTPCQPPMSILVHNTTPVLLTIRTTNARANDQPPKRPRTLASGHHQVPCCRFTTGQHIAVCPSLSRVQYICIHNTQTQWQHLTRHIKGVGRRLPSVSGTPPPPHIPSVRTGRGVRLRQPVSASSQRVAGSTPRYIRRPAPTPGYAAALRSRALRRRRGRRARPDRLPSPPPHPRCLRSVGKRPHHHSVSVGKCRGTDVQLRAPLSVRLESPAASAMRGNEPLVMIRVSAPLV